MTTNYSKHNAEATANDHKPAAALNVGDFIHTATAGGKDCNFTDWIDARTSWDMGNASRLCQIVDIIDVAEETDILTGWLEREAPAHRGGSQSDDVAEDKQPGQMTREDWATFYDLITVFRKPSGQWVGVDCQGYNYWRYVHMPKNYAALFAAEHHDAIDHIKARDAKREAEKAAELAAHAEAYKARKAELIAEYCELTQNPANGRQVGANVRKFFKKHFPGLTFKIRATANYWGTAYDVTAEAPKDTPEEMRQRIAEACAVWSDTLPIGEMRDADEYHNECEGRACPMQIFGNINYRVKVDYWLDTPYTAPTQPEPVKPEDPATKEATADGLQLVDYSEKAVALIGDTRAIKEQLKALGGKFNARLKCGAGWIFSKRKENELRTLLAI